MKPSIDRANEPPAYACVLSLLTASRHVRAALAARLGVGVFSEVQLTTLIALYTLEPMPVTVDVICRQADVDRAQVVMVVDALLAHEFLVQSPHRVHESRAFIRLTRRGRETAVVMAHLFLETVEQLTGNLSPSQSATLRETCEGLITNARNLQA